MTHLVLKDWKSWRAIPPKRFIKAPTRHDPESASTRSLAANSSALGARG